ncbi:MAG TPA: DUF2589 domain-containing protein [Gemmatimonadales bacterium]|nr:DUF2589 domain-containing protein [Gemmatimonadales bacterium]
MIGGPLVAVVNAQAQAAISTVNFIKEVGFQKPVGDQDPTAASVNNPIYVTFKYPKEVAAYQPAVGKGDGSINVTLGAGGTGYTVSTTPALTIDPAPAGGVNAAGTATVDASGVVTGVTITNAGKGYTSAPSVTLPAAVGGTAATFSVTADTAQVPAQIQEMKLEVPILTMVPVPFIRVEQATIDFNAKINSVEYRKTDTNIKVDAALEAKAGWLWGSAKLKVSASFQKSTTEGMNVERTFSMAIHVRAVQDEMPAGLDRILGILEDSIRGQPSKAPVPVTV